MLGEDGLSTETEIKMPKMNRELLPEIEEPGEAFDWENPYGRIPCALNYYDNDDGYWDDWIRTKRERGGMPSITFREYFKH